MKSLSPRNKRVNKSPATCPLHRYTMSINCSDNLLHGSFHRQQVSKLAQFNANSTMTHWKAGLHVLHYLKSTQNHCITYKRSSIPTRVFDYADADQCSQLFIRLFGYSQINEL